MCAESEQLSRSLVPGPQGAAVENSLASAREDPNKTRKATGMFSQWLRRRDALPSPVLDNPVSRPKAAAEAQEQGTPTWSEASEASDFANIDVNHTDSGSNTSRPAGSSVHMSLADNQSTARLTDRLGGWLTGVTTAAGILTLHGNMSHNALELRTTNTSASLQGLCLVVLFAVAQKHFRK